MKSGPSQVLLVLSSPGAIYSFCVCCFSLLADLIFALLLFCCFAAVACLFVILGPCAVFVVLRWFDCGSFACLFLQSTGKLQWAVVALFCVKL